MRAATSKLFGLMCVIHKAEPFWGYALIGNSRRGLFERDDYCACGALATQILLIDNPSKFLTEILDIMQIGSTSTLHSQITQP